MVKSLHPRFWLPIPFELPWFGVYFFIIAAWVSLFLLGAFQSHHPFILTDWASIAGVFLNAHNHNIDFIYLFGMWGMMSLAMMLPSFIPTLRVYEDLKSTGAGSDAGFWALVAGYIAIWVVYALVMTVIQIYLLSLNVLTDSLAGPNSFPIVILLFAAGTYQFMNFKDRCLTYCRNPLLIFLARGEVNLVKEFMSGTRFATWCLGCCIFLMSLCLITGLMNIAWMGLLTIIITLEKLPELGKYVSKPLGIVLMVSSVLIYIFS